MVMGSARFVGRRIREVREARGMTQADLAEALGRTPTSISYWENGQRSPGLDDIVVLARVLGVEPSSLLPHDPPRVLARARAAEVALWELADIVDGLVERFEHRPPPEHRVSIPSTNPIEVAGIARRSADQDHPPVDVVAVIAACGMHYTEEPLPDALSGLVVVAGDAPVIAVRRADPPHRRRFSAAHELGHALLAHHETFHVDLTLTDGFPVDYNWRHERAANEFAAALLMPVALLRDDVAHQVQIDARTLAHRYDVSEQAMSIRLGVLGVRVSRAAEDPLF